MHERDNIETCDKIIRKFWSAFLGEKLDSDGQIPGAARWRQMNSGWAEREADRYCAAVCSKVLRGRDEDECIASGVAALKVRLNGAPREETRPPSPEEQAQMALLEKHDWTAI